MKSLTGFITTVIEVLAGGSPVVELVAVTVKVRACGATRAGTVGAMNFCTEPSVAAGVIATAGPAVCCQL